MVVDLFEFEEEPVVTVWRVDDYEFSFSHRGGEFSLFSQSEESISRNCDDESAGRDQGERVRRARSIASDIVRIHFASEVNVAIGIESRSEFVALISEVRLSAEDWWR